MNRDMDLIRRIALAVADLPHDKILKELEGVDERDFALHALWMQEAGLIVADLQKTTENTTPKSAWINRLTWDGCEFADAVRNDTLWNKAKATIIKPTSSFTFGVIRDWLKSEILNGLLPLGR